MNASEFLKLPYTKEKGKYYIVISREQVLELDKRFKDTQEDEIDVSEHFRYGSDDFLEMINPYDKRQGMSFDKDGFMFITSNKCRKSYLKDNGKKAVLVDCEFEDIKVGDWCILDEHFNKNINIIGNYMLLITKKNEEKLRCMFYDMDNIIESSGVERAKFYKYKKVVLKDL